LKKVKEFFKRTIWNLDIWVPLFQDMYSKEVAIQIRHFTQELFDLWRAFAFVQAFMEELEQERAIEGIKRVLPIRMGTAWVRAITIPTAPILFPTKRLHLSQIIQQVIPISCEKPFLLNEIKKHQTAQHE
jgi:hypothetical protein